MRKLALFAAALVIACASGTTTVAPEVALVQTSVLPLHGVLTNPRGGIPMTYRLEITNPSDDPVRLVSVEIESVGESGAYSLSRVRHSFRQVIPARSKESLEIRAWVQRLQVDTSGRSNQPVNLRGTARFETRSGTVRRNFVAQGQ